MSRAEFTRRQTLVGGIAAITAACSDGAAPNREDPTMPNTQRMPVAYVPHGGGPWPFVELGLEPAEVDAMATYLRGLADVPAVTPAALLVISAHWEAPLPTLMTAARPPMLYDYSGFPPETYALQWPAPGAPQLANRIRGLLGEAGFTSAEDPARGFDHGTFVPMMLTYPAAQLPTLQLSLVRGLDPAQHLAIGRALAPLRDEGVFIIGSGMSYHNMRGFRDPRARDGAETFDRWLREAAVAEPAERDRLLAGWIEAPAARDAHPREEHLLPLMVVAGAATGDRGRLAFDGRMFGIKLSGFHYG